MKKLDKDVKVVYEYAGNRHELTMSEDSAETIHSLIQIITKSPTITVGERVKKLRLDKGWSQEELAKESGLARTSVCRVETCPEPIGRKVAMKLGKAFKCDYRLFL